MNSLIRAVITFVAAVAAFYFTFWVGGALLTALNAPVWIGFVLAFGTAGFVGRWVWTRPAMSGGLAQAVVTGALLVGAIGFCGGFFGPLVFAPDANQGPLLGIFITGPLGFLAGAVGGGVFWWVRRNRSQD